MSDDINSPRVRQIVAIHAEQAATAKAESQHLSMLADRLRDQRDNLYELVLAAAHDYRAKAPVMGALKTEFNARGWELLRLARGFTDTPGPCPIPHTEKGKCPVCGYDEDRDLPF